MSEFFHGQVTMLRHVMWRSPEIEWRVWHVLAFIAWCVFCEWLGEALKRRNNRNRWK